MKKFYKIENGKAQVGSGTFVPDGFIVYEEEPQELIDALTLEKQEQDLTTQINEAKSYLNETSWIWEKFNRNVVVLKDMTEEEFSLKYADIIAEQERNRLLINELEVQLGGN